MPNFKDITGKRFGRLVVIRQKGIDEKSGQARWLCQCECGRKSVALGANLRRGTTTSCGCKRIGANNCQYRHGYAGKGKYKKHPLYGIWGNMHQRCRNPKHVGYKNYGGRGIYVCKRWNSFPDFLADMGERPSPKHSLGRIDNDGIYKPTNVYWATPEEQTQNRRPERPRKRIDQFTDAELIAELARRAHLRPTQAP